ncbi:hypothetical protein ABK040_004758 [Willaertia magna]
MKSILPSVKGTLKINKIALRSAIISTIKSSNRYFSNNLITLQNDSTTNKVSTISLDIKPEFYQGMSAAPFDKEVSDVLLAPIDTSDIEVLPDGILYLPEIKYRRILNKAFGPGGWCLVPRGDYIVENGTLIQSYALYCLGRFVAQAYGEQQFDEQGYKSLGSTLEGCKSNALMRCCKDIGIASELWDPVFINSYMKANVVSVWCEHHKTKVQKKLFRRKDREIGYPYVEKTVATSNTAPTPGSTKQESKQQQDSKRPETKPEPATKENANSFSFDPEGELQFGKFKGKKFQAIKDTPEFSSWLDYLTRLNINPNFVEQVRKHLNK